MTRTLILNLLLAAYGNGGSLVVGTAMDAAAWAGVLLGVLLVALMLLWGRWSSQLTVAEVGLTPRRFVRSAGVGLLVGFGSALPLTGVR
jgi:hypothetical protein